MAASGGERDQQQTILVIEDHREFQELVKALLEAEGYRVVAAGTGTAALRAHEMVHPSLILLDSALPDSDGVQVTQALRARQSGAPIILMTADTRSGEMAREIGAIEVLVKPFSTAALLAAIRRGLGGLVAPANTYAAADYVSPTRDLDEEPPSRVGARLTAPVPAAPSPVVASVQWEYCQLIAAGRSEVAGETYYDVDIIYLGETVTQRPIASREGPAAAPWTTSPWKQAIGLLGLAGWEMVTIQHGDYAGRAAEGSTLSWNTVVAYFRRPVVAGRPITEPKITLTRA